MIRFFFIVILCSIAVLETRANTESYTKEDSTDRIIIIAGEGIENGDRNLSPLVEAFRQNGIIHIVFNKFMGSAYINICNINTGKQVEQMCDTGLGTVSIDMNNMGAGEYYIIIHTENGSIFTGEFETIN